MIWSEYGQKHAWPKIHAGKWKQESKYWSRSMPMMNVNRKVDKGQNEWISVRLIWINSNQIKINLNKKIRIGVVIHVWSEHQKVKC